ncbi:ATP-dependent Zn protease [Egbenema bharatensis]|uniref:ATP-dependent Zn protease n=1 Tax=Egbenema bharatensis TaxID=3463334 RepID=UPI003A8AFB66
MNQTTLNLTAITIFTLVMTSLLGPLIHLSPAVPAIATFSILSFITVDTLGWQGQAGTLIVDWLNQFSPDHRLRVVRHEAGHFLAAHLLEIPVTGYTLSAWEAFRQGKPGLGGVSFGSQELEAAVNQGSLPAQLFDRYCTVLMAGIAAESLSYDKPEGGQDDRQNFRLLWSKTQRPPSEGKQKEQWAIFQAKSLIQSHWEAYEALVSAMEQRASVEDCQQAIEQLKRSEF